MKGFTQEGREGNAESSLGPQWELRDYRQVDPFQGCYGGSQTLGPRDKLENGEKERGETMIQAMDSPGCGDQSDLGSEREGSG